MASSGEPRMACSPYRVVLPAASVRVAVGERVPTLAVAIVALPFADVLAARPHQLARAVEHVVEPAASVARAIVERERAEAIHAVGLPMAVVHIAVGPFDFALTRSLTCEPVARVGGAAAHESAMTI